MKCMPDADLCSLRIQKRTPKPQGVPDKSPLDTHKHQRARIPAGCAENISPPKCKQEYEINAGRGFPQPAPEREGPGRQGAPEESPKSSRRAPRESPDETKTTSKYEVL